MGVKEIIIRFFLVSGMHFNSKPNSFGACSFGMYQEKFPTHKEIKDFIEPSLKGASFTPMNIMEMSQEDYESYFDKKCDLGQEK